MLDIFRYDPLSPKNPKHQFLEASRTKLGRSDLPVKAARFSVMLVHVHCREEGTRNAVTKKAYRCAMLLERDRHHVLLRHNVRTINESYPFCLF